MVPLSTTTTFQEDDNMALLSSLLNFGYCTNEPQPAQDGGQKEPKRKGRRSRKSRKEGEEAKKRRLSDEQVKFLETSFERERKLESARKARLASEAGLDPKQVAVWFQNRRARWKSKQLEGEYNKLKVELQEAVVEKCHLEAEMLKLKEQLAEAKTKITKLSGGGGGWERSSSPSTSLSVDTTHCQPFIGEEHLSYLYEYNYVNMLADWVDFYGM